MEGLDEVLGWRGLGHCDGNDIGGNPPDGQDGTLLNLFCPVVDTALGAKALRSFVRAFPIHQHCMIATREPGEDSDYELAWASLKSQRTFDVFSYQ